MMATKHPITLTIDPEFRALIPPLTEEERAHLEANILRDGCRDPLVTWAGRLLDGHNRYDICTAHNLPFHTCGAGIESRDAAKIWIIENQFGKRNLTAFARGELVLKLEPMIAALAKQNQSAAGGDQKSEKQKSAQAISPVKTRKVLAKKAGLSHDTIRKVKVIARKASPKVKAALRAGKTTINREHKKLTQPKAKPAVETTEAEREAADVKALLAFRERLQSVRASRLLKALCAELAPAKGTKPAADPIDAEPCRRCKHPKDKHWPKGCVMGCACSEGRYMAVA